MKEKTMANIEQYRAVLEDLLKQKSELAFKIGEIDSAVSALRRLMPVDDIPKFKDSQQPLPIVTFGKYSGMSVRWAVLNLLVEDAASPMTTGEIAEALTAGGVTTGGKSFAGNVSAVLSGMNREKGEVTPTANGWLASDKGRSAWIHIKGSREAKTSTPTDPSLSETSERLQPALQ